MRALTLTLVQPEPHWQAPHRNREMFAELFEEVPAESALVVLPEMFSTGFTMASQAVAEPMDGPTMQWLIDSAAALDKIVCGSVVILEEGVCFNRFVWVRPDGEVARYDKRHLFRMAREHEHYGAGRERIVLELEGWRILPFVCYDLRFPVWLRNHKDYELLLGVANWPAARQRAWHTLLRARAIENLCYAVGVNRVGIDGNDIAYRGGSCAYDAAGEALFEAGEAPSVQTITLDPAALSDWRERFPAHLDADAFTLGS